MVAASRNESYGAEGLSEDSHLRLLLESCWLHLEASQDLLFTSPFLLWGKESREIVYRCKFKGIFPEWMGFGAPDWPFGLAEERDYIGQTEEELVGLVGMDAVKPAGLPFVCSAQKARPHCTVCGLQASWHCLYLFKK